MPENALLFVLLLVAVATGWVLGVRFKREKMRESGLHSAA